MKKEKRSLFSRIFGTDVSEPTPQKASTFKILDDTKASFTMYRNDFENDPDVRACVDTIARNAAKMHPRHIRNSRDKFENMKGSLYHLLAKQPNELQNAYKFYYQIISELEFYNNAFVYILRDENLKVKGLYPLEFKECTFYEYENELYVKFKFGKGKERFVPYKRLIHLTRFTSKDGTFGGNTVPITKALSIKHIMDEGIVNAIKTTQSIKGVVKSTQSMLKPEDVKKMRDQFVKDFIEHGDRSGIGGLDASTDFTPVKIEPTTASDGQVKEIKSKIYSYFGVNEKIVQSAFNEDEWNAFYESILEPIGLQMSLEFSNKLFTPTEINFGNEIIFESNALQYASNKTKIEVIRYCSNIMTINELREVMNLSPIENGDAFMIDQNHEMNEQINGSEPTDEPSENEEENNEGN